jgi:hypothetical protein
MQRFSKMPTASTHCSRPTRVSQGRPAIPINYVCQCMREVAIEMTARVEIHRFIKKNRRNSVITARATCDCTIWTNSIVPIEASKV